MPYSAYTWFFSLLGTFRTDCAYPGLQIASFVPVVKIAPGVQAESGNPLCAIHPEVFVCTPNFGAPLVVPVVALPDGLAVIVTEPHPLNASNNAMIASSENTIFFILVVFP